MLGVRVFIDGILLPILIFTIVSVRATAVLIAVASRRVCDVRPCDGFFPSGLVLRAPRRIRISFSPHRPASWLVLVVCSLLDPVSSLFYWLPNSGCGGAVDIVCRSFLSCRVSSCSHGFLRIASCMCAYFCSYAIFELGNLHLIRLTFGAVFC